MRKIPAVLAVLSLSAVGLVGCSAPWSSSCQRPADADPAVTDLITVEGDIDAEPEVSLYTPFRTDATVVEDLEVGEGTAITTDAQLVVLDLTIVDGETGETVFASPYDGDLSSPFLLSGLVEDIPPLSDALSCATEGTRTVVALPPGSVSPEVAASLEIGEDSSLVAVVDVRKVYLAAASGSLVFNSGFGLPAVVRAPDGSPGVVVPDSSAPTELVSQVLIRGEGEVVTGEQPVRVNILAVSWNDKTVTNTTWGAEPSSISLDAAPDDFTATLVGQTVGSQLMVVNPAETEGGDAQIFVIDILGLDAPAAE